MWYHKIAVILWNHKLEFTSDNRFCDHKIEFAISQNKFAYLTYKVRFCDITKLNLWYHNMKVILWNQKFEFEISNIILWYYKLFYWYHKSILWYQNSIVWYHKSIIIITLFQKLNIFGTSASLAYGPQLQSKLFMIETSDNYLQFVQRKSPCIKLAASGLPNPAHLDGVGTSYLGSRPAGYHM